jgi:hypothetical protein
MAITHLDKRKIKRLGWFQKGKDAKPAHKNYRKSCEGCGKGFHGPRGEAHHIVPQTSIEESKETYIKGKTPPKEVARYVNDVQYITDWNINKPDNMMGLPTFHSYELFFQYKDRLDPNATGSSAGKKLIKWFNKYSSKTRKKWLAEIAAGASPENNVIHNPVCWGHAIYNVKVKNYLLSQVWSKLDIAKAKHSVDAQKIQAAFNTASTTWHGALKGRGVGATRAAWSKRKKGTKWYKPFTMADVNEDPLYG